MPEIDWRKVPGRYIKDPRLGHRFGRNYPAGEISDAYWNLHWLGTDRDGLIYNESPIRDYELGDKSFRRVFLFGGSAAMGLGVPENRYTISSVLERYLRQTIPNARVANCGCGAYMSWHQLIYLATEMIGFEPDMVVVLDGHNDFIHSSLGNKGLHGGWIPNTHRSLDDIVQIVLEAVGSVSLRQAWKRWFFGTGLGRKIDLILSELTSAYTKEGFSSRVWGESDYSTWSIKPESIDWYLRNARSTIGVARSNGAKVVYLVQPQMLYVNRTWTEDEQDLMRRVNERTPPLLSLGEKWVTQALPRFSNMREELHDGSDIWIENAISWLDDERRSVYHDYVHYNELGQRIVGERIGDIILRMWDPSSRYIPAANGKAIFEQRGKA